MIGSGVDQKGQPIRYGAGLVNGQPLPAHNEQAAYMEAMLDGQPWGLANYIRGRHAWTERERGRQAANLEIRDIADTLARYAGDIPADATDTYLREWSAQRADGCEAAMQATGGDAIDAYMAGRRYCEAWGIDVPSGDAIGAVLRMRCGLWWRRQIRRVFGRRVEQSARAIGAVNGRAQHISDNGFARWTERQNAARDMLESTTIECEQTGEQLSLAEAVDAGQANPKNRRGEMMMTVRGLERCAIARGHVGIFITWTVPPEMHAVHSRSGAFLGGRHTTPREGQQWLCRQWARARASLNRRRITVYGIRVAEPHHDGTPHWHLLLFVPAAEQEAVIDTMRHYGLDGDERAARVRYGFDVERIDTTRGSAVGYIAKYIGKSIDGHAVGRAHTRGSEGEAVESDDAAEKASRVRAWASQWGIRQFQLFGATPAGVWRELRRIRQPIEGNPQAEALRAAANQGEIVEYMELLGGPALPRDQRPARVVARETGETGRYGEAQTRASVEAFGVVYESRPYSWVRVIGAGKGEQREFTRIAVDVSDIEPDEVNVVDIALTFEREWVQRSGEAASTWTRGNNCTRGADEGHKIGHSKRIGTDKGGGRTAEIIADAGGDARAGAHRAITGVFARSGWPH